MIKRILDVMLWTCLSILFIVVPIAEKMIEVSPEPVIESQETERETTYSIPNTFEGTATIVKPTGTECYEGLIRIDVDGEKIRVTVMDAVESDFADNF